MDRKTFLNLHKLLREDPPETRGEEENLGELDAYLQVLGPIISQNAAQQWHLAEPEQLEESGDSAAVSLGQALRRLRDHKKLSRAALAEQAGVEHATITLLENGVLNCEDISVQTVYELMHALDLADETVLELSEMKEALHAISTIQLSSILDSETAAIQTELNHRIDAISTIQNAHLHLEERSVAEVGSGQRLVAQREGHHQPLSSLKTDSLATRPVTPMNQGPGSGPQPPLPSDDGPAGAVVRIWRNQQYLVGSGFLVSGRLILTSSSAVSKALGLNRIPLLPPASALLVEFPFVAPDELRLARIVMWQPDHFLAGLELIDPLPEQAEPLYLAEVSNLWNRPFKTVGGDAPAAHPIWISGLLQGQTIIDGLEATADGGLVWDESLGCAIGLVVAIDPQSTSRARLMMPTAVIRQAWSALDQAYATSSRNRLHEFLTTYYSWQQLETLCEVLDIPFRELTGQGLCARITCLLEWVDRNHRLSDLVNHLKETRATTDDHAFWETFVIEKQPEYSPLPGVSALFDAGSVPPLIPERLTGRGELLQQIKEMLIDSHMDKPVALLGRGGIGKTAVAITLVHKYSEFFPGGVFWGALGEFRGDIRPILLTWARKCNPNFFEKLTESALTDGQLLTLVREAIREYTQGRPALFVVDEVRPDWAKQAQSIKQILPASSALLLTLRDEQVAGQLEAHVQKVEQLSPDDALELLQTYCDPEAVAAERPVAEELVAALGWLPLAIRIVGAYLNRPDQGQQRLNRYLLLMKAQAAKIVTEINTDNWTAITTLDTENSGLTAQVQNNIKFSFLRTYEALDPKAQYLFRYLTVFAAGPVRLESIAGVLGDSPLKLRQSLAQLTHAALLEKTEQSDRFALPALFRLYGQHLLDHKNERAAAKQAHMHYYLKFARAHARIEREAHDKLESRLPNLMLAFEHAVETKSYHVIKGIGFALCIDSHFFGMRGGYTSEAILMLQATVEACHHLGHHRAETRALGSLGLAHESAAEPHVAIEYYEAAQQLSRQGRLRVEEGIWLSRLGNIYGNVLGQPQKAFDYLKKALEIFRSEGDQRLEGVGMASLGRIYSEQGHRQEAIQHYEQALRLAEQAGQLQDKAVCLDSLGLIHRHNGEIGQAIKCFEQALVIHRQLGDQISQVDTLNDIGLAHYSRGQLESADKFFYEAFALSRKTQHLPGKANALGNLGLTHRSRSKLPLAVSYFKQALELSRYIGNRRDEGNALSNLGIAFRYLGRIKEAIDYHERSLEIRQVIGDRRGEGSSLGNLGICYLNLGQIDLAIDYLQQALAISREVGERRSEGNALAYLGRAHRHKGQIIDSIDYLVQALTISEEIGHKRSQANRKGRLGNAYRKLGQFEKAVEHINDAISLSCLVEDERGKAVHVGYLGLVYRETGQVEKAQDHILLAYNMSREIGNRREEGIWLGHIGVIYYLRQRYEDAIDYHQAALKINREVGNRRHEGIALGNLGLVYHAIEQNYQAIDLIKQALAIHTEIGDQVKMATSYTNLGSIYYQLGQTTEAIAAYKQAFDLYRQISFQRGESKVLSLLGNTYLKLNQPQQALAHLKQAYALSQTFGSKRELVDQLGQMREIYGRLNDYRRAAQCETQAKVIADEIGYWPDRQKRLQNQLMVY